MSLIRLFIVTSWFFLTMVTAAEADPITMAAVGAFASSWLGSILINLVVGLVVSYVVGLIQRMLNPEPEKKIGFELRVQVGDDQPIGFTAGASATGGTRKYLGTWGSSGKTPNAYLVDVIQIGDIPCPGLDGLWVDDQHATVLWAEAGAYGAPVLQYRRDGVDHMWVKFRTGLETTADAYLTSSFAGGERPWSQEMIGRGCPHAIITCLVNDDVYSGQPSYVFEPSPTVWYDLRKDSTNGGSGSHRWDDYSTWEPSTNPVILMYNIIRGVYYGDEWVFGGQNLPAFRLPQSSWMAAANECDVLVPTGDGGTERQFRFGAEITCDKEPLSVLEQLSTTCNARIAEVGGRFEILVGAPAASVYSFSDDDINVMRGQSYQPHPNLSATHNAIEATYPEPSEKWSMKDAPSRYNNLLEAEDGNRRLPTPVAFELVPFHRQVQRLMKAMLLEERRFRIHQFVMMPETWLITPNCVVSWTSVRNGYVNKKFLVVRIEGEPGMGQLVTLKEIDPSDYSWSSSEEIPVVIGTLNPVPVPAQPMVDWSAQPASIDDSSGVGRRPAILLGWDGDQVDVEGVSFEVRLKETEEVVYRNRTDGWAAGSLLISQNLLPAEDYEVRGRYLAISQRRTLWSDWIPVRTLDIRMSLDDVNDVFRQVTGILTGEGEGSLAERLADVTDRFARLAAIQTSASTKAYTDKKEVEVRINQDRAYLLKQVSLVVDDLQALATDVTLLAVEFDDNVAFVGTQLEALATADTAMATLINEVAVELDGVSASGLFKMQAVAAPGGVSVRLAILARKSTSDAFVETGFVIDIFPNNTTRIALKADSLYLLNSSNGVVSSPFNVVGGVVYMNNVVINGALIQDLTVGTEKITPAAVTKMAVTAASGQDGSNGPFNTISMVPDAGYMRIDVSLFQNLPYANSGNFGNYTIYLYRNGLYITSRTLFYDDNFCTAVAFTAIDSPAIGETATYQVYKSGGGFTISDCVIALINFKK